MSNQEHSGKAQQAEERYRLLVDAIIDYAVYMLDPDGIIVSWNPGAQRLKGYTADEIVGSHFSVFYSEADREAGLPARGLSTAASVGRFENEGWRVRRDGTRFMAYVVIDAIRDESGQLSGFAKVTQDITERYETQKALDYAREELFQSQKMEAVGRLTGGVAHDFNNLLTIVLISLNLARKRLPDPSVLALIDNAIQGAERGVSMTKRMLAFSRRQPLRLEAVSIADLVAGMRGLIHQSIHSSINVVTQISPDLPAVQADVNQLEAALLNLVFNARDAMPDGGDLVITARHSQVQDSDMRDGHLAEAVLLEISDSGQGMDEETLDKAIEPFFTTKGVGKGTGLGLSMVHGIVEQLGGRLKLLSTAGAGTTVQLWLPIAEGEQPACVPETQPDSGATASTLRILVVDDDELVLLNTCALLKDMGHATVHAHSARQALDLLETEAVELVITDHAMPEMTGSQLAERLSKLYPSLPLILASGYAEIVDEPSSAIPTLAKPFNEASLSQAINRAMAQQAGA